MKIDIELLKAKITDLPAKIRQVLKTIYDLPHSGKYLIASFFLFIFFLIATFPYDFLIKKKIYELEGKSFRSIDISGFDFSIFGETYFDNLIIVLNNGNEVTCKNSILNIALNPVTLLIKNKLKSDFQFDSLRYSTSDFECILNVNGNMDLIIDSQSSLPKDGPVRIIISDSIIKLNDISIPSAMGPLNLKMDSISIQSGNIDSVISNKTLKFNTFKLSGNDISCDITGFIELSDLTANSKLDLTVSIDSESAVLDQYKDILASYIKNSILSLRIRGTLAKPELMLIGAGKNEN